MACQHLVGVQCQECATGPEYTDEYGRLWKRHWAGWVHRQDNPRIHDLICAAIAAYMRRRMAEPGPCSVEALAREIEEGRPWEG